jgi:Xaa-Pro aminopeptidase
VNAVTTTDAQAPATTGRIEKVRALLEEQQLDALLISDPFNRRYLSGFTGSNGYLIVSRFSLQIATDFRYWEQAERQCPEFELFKFANPMKDWFANLMRPWGGHKVGFEAASLSYGAVQEMRELIGDMEAGDRAELVPTNGLVEKLRAIKEPAEVAAIERVIALGDAAFEAVAARIEPGWTERAVAWEIEQYIRAHGGDGVSFSTIVAGGTWGALPHARPRDVPLREGEAVVIDMGALLDGYCSDMTRTVCLGEPDARFKEIYDIVLAAQLAAEAMIEPGMDGEKAHMLAQSVIDEAGYGEQFGHGLGHGIGLQVHEAPRIAKRSEDVLQDGMLFSVEPGIYLPEWGGVRIEDLVVLENGRCRVLTRAPKLLFAGGEAPSRRE